MFEPLYDVERLHLATISAHVLGYSIGASLLFIIGSNVFTGKFGTALYRLFLMSLTVACVSLCATGILPLTAQDVDAENVLGQNLKQKYDIEKVVSDSSYILRPYLETEQLIMVETADGREAVFKLTQNPDTFEPTLHESVDNADSAPVTLKDITK